MTDLAAEENRAADGWMQLRLDSLSDLDLFLAVRHPQRSPALIIEVDKEAVPYDWGLPDVRGLELLRGPGQIRSVRIVILASQAGFWDPFVVLTDDLLGVLSSAKGATEALKALERRLQMWAHFFERAPAGQLGRAERLGLIGELFLLDTHLLSSAGARAIVGWQGPEAGPHDFVIGAKAIEVKCTTAQHPIQLEISSVRQLDNVAFHELYVFGLCLVEGPAGSLCLPDLIRAIRQKVAQAYPSAAGRFEDLLLQAGYTDLHQDFYATERFNVQIGQFFEVREGFPVLREAMLPNGVGNVRYCIDWSACQPFAILPATALRGL